MATQLPRRLGGGASGQAAVAFSARRGGEQESRRAGWLHSQRCLPRHSGILRNRRSQHTYQSLSLKYKYHRTLSHCKTHVCPTDPGRLPVCTPGPNTQGPASRTEAASVRACLCQGGGHTFNPLHRCETQKLNCLEMCSYTGMNLPNKKKKAI